MSRTHVAAHVLAVVLVLWSGGRGASGQETGKEPDPTVVALQAKAGQFLEGVSLGRPQNAYQELLAGGPLLKQTEGLRALVEKTGEIETKYGRYRASESVAAKRIGTDLVLLRYLYKCENFPVVWHFAFYRTPNAGETLPVGGPWRVVSVRFDTDLDALGR
jgi:hypothetical protein